MKKNGFTLVELLAVIVILGIIMIIAIPAVLQVMTTSKVKSFSVYAKKVRMEAEKTNYKDELNGNISSSGMYVYDIKEDLGLSSTGSYKGYVVVNGCSDSKEYYVFLADDSYMVFDYGDSDPEDIENYEKFSNYNETSWNESAGTKEQVAGRILNLGGEYSCKVYDENGNELTAGGGTEIPDTPTSSNVAIFDKGVNVNHTMLNKLRGDTSYVIENTTDMYGTNVEVSWKSNDSFNPDTGIKNIIKSTTSPDASKNALEVQSSDSPNKIYMWYENSNIYWYTQATKVFANKNASCMFANLGGATTLDISNIDFSQTTNFFSLFAFDKSMTSLDVSSMNVVNAEDFTQMFYYMESIEAINVSMWKANKVRETSFMFAYCTNATMIKFPSNLVNTNTKKIAGMFMEDAGITSLDISNFKTDNVISFESLFYGCKNIKSLDVSNWNTGKVTNMEATFAFTTQLTSIDLTKWDTSNVDSYFGMFQEAKGIKELDLSSFTIKQGANAYGMFYKMTNLTTIYTSGSWRDKISDVAEESKAVFTGDTKLVGGNGTKYSGTSSATQNKTRAIIDGENGEKGYFTRKTTGETAR